MFPGKKKKLSIVYSNSVALAIYVHPKGDSSYAYCGYDLKENQCV